MKKIIIYTIPKSIFIVNCFTMEIIINLTPFIPLSLARRGGVFGFGGLRPLKLPLLGRVITYAPLLHAGIFDM